VNKSAFGRIGIAALIGGVAFLIAAALLIYSLKGTSLRYTIDGLVVDSPKWELRAAIASEDEENISREFTKATYRPEWKMSEAIPTMQSYLSNTNPFVRCYAGKALLTFGDQSGYPTLLDLVSLSNPAPGLKGGREVRIDAAMTLAQFREVDAAGAITALYEQTHNAELLNALSALGVQAPEEKNFPFITNPNTIVQYAQSNDRWFIPQITAVFNNTKKPALKAASAWALATMSGNQDAISYLVQAAQPAIKAQLGVAGTAAPGQPDFLTGLQALKYLGSIPSSQTKAALEAALDSQIPSVVQIATVNLLFNQGGSDKAMHVVAQQLEEATPLDQWMPWELVLSIAAQLNSNPTIQAAGQVFAKKSDDGSWQLYTVERKNWPIYNWIDNYVVKLNTRF